ncbi:MAG: DNA-directed RNA polymerase subunit alpha [Endomicrobium sp.]|jgi:DNA-directed RNA polymerase subunit alpha|nr:DNA-directed RNA polymerase subunit alpha [Endomicrobium sp.]
MKAPDLEKLRRFVLDEKTSTPFYGCFTASPFERGYGHTIGNSLRRVLLSSLNGAAITSVKVTGALHEFAVIKGVKEDVAQIVLNLKKVRVKLNSDGPERLYLRVENPGKVTAKDIETNLNVEIMNPEQEIAHIDNNTVLEMEMEVNMGKGYMLAEELKSYKDSVGTILLDSLFSPVTKVNYEVENTRVEQNLNYDMLIIEVWTDGSIAPKDALIKSAKILRNSLVTFTGLPVDEEVVVDNSKAYEQGIFGKNVSTMVLSTRSSNILKNARIKTIGQLVKLTENEILKLHNFGKHSFEEVKGKLEKLNLTFGMEFNNGAKK